MIRKSIIAVGVAACVSLAPSFALVVQAADAVVAESDVAQCACVAALPAAGRTVGSMTSVTGDVLITQAAGPQQAVVGSPINVGSSILVGPAGSAALVVGQSCALDVQADRSVEVAAVGGSLCVRVAEVSAAGLVGSGGGLTTGQAAALGLLGAAAVGGAVAVGVGSDGGSGGDDEPVSP